MTKTVKYDIAMEGDPKAPVPTLYENGKRIGAKDSLVFDKTKDKMKKHTYYKLRFDIRDFKNSTLRFVPDRDDMFWAQAGTTCPTQRSQISGVLWVSDHDPSGEWIEVMNADMTPLEFWFTLNFARKGLADPQPSDFVPLDPGGLNKNGGIDGTILITASALAGGAAAAATALLLGSKTLAPLSVAVVTIGGAVLGAIVGALSARL